MHTLAVLGPALLLSAALAVSVVKAAAPTPGASPMNDFACDLYKQFAKAKPGENLFFSPYSIETALAMTAEGARGITATEMLAVLHTPDKLDPLHATLGELAARLAGKPVPEEMRAKIKTMRDELDALNKELEANHKYDDETMRKMRRSEELARQLNELLKTVDQFEFKSANALWVEQTFQVEKPYLDKIARLYSTGGAFPIDFRQNYEPARAKINAWIASQTNDRIKDLLAKGQVDQSTRLVLTNAVYFKGEWTDPFDAKETKNEPFTLLDRSTQTVPLMRSAEIKGTAYAAFNGDGSPFSTPRRVPLDKRSFDDCYPDAGGFTVLQLPYKGDALSMIVLLPRSGDALTKLEQKLSGDGLATWLAALDARKVDVSLPRFKLETSYDLVDALQALGMRRAFIDPAKPDSAEFDGISSSSDPRQRLFIGVAVHKAFLDVNEKGTEAAAATAIGMAAGSAMPRDVPFTPVFRADHPFLLIIRDNATNTALFMGRVTSPAK
ncbi:MAG: serpin family protein [Tepidisphaeraceae bacterium]